MCSAISLGSARSFALELAVLHLLRAARRRAGDRPHGERAILDARHHLG